ncbi:MAG: TetR/AcrR family transcriptional regulator [Myxococcota bacterium]
MPRPALREDEIEAFRSRLCDAATRRFAEGGFEGVSLRGLADDLGCSRATPYRYFENKEEIFAAVRARAFEALADACEEVPAGEPDPLRRLAALGRTYLRFACDEPHAYRVAFELGQPDAARYPELLVQQARAWQTIRGAVQFAWERGVVEGDPETVSHLYWAALHGLAGLELAGQLRARSFDALAGPMIDTLLRGTTRRPRSDSPTLSVLGEGPQEQDP